MKITNEKIKRDLIDKYGWSILETKCDPNYHELIKDVKSVIDNILRKEKNISIK